MNDFPVPKDAYVAFDGLTIKEKIKDRLDQTGIFTDQNYEGSNLAAINDSIAMSFSLLLYYLNQNSVNGQFSETTVYENMNRIVKELNYNPIGYQTASVSFSMSANNLDAGFYTIPRYSNITVGGINYSLRSDLSFTKASNGTLEKINGIESDSVLYQGTFTEFPIFTPAGTPNEIVYLTVDDTLFVDNFTIDVYVQTDGVWEKWDKTQSLYLNNSEDKNYELRFNENKVYEIKFGDGINGKQLTSSNRVLIYYLVSNGQGGELGSGGLAGRKMVQLVSSNLQPILAQENVTYLTNAQIQFLSFDNKFPSTYFTEPESISSIRKNAPGVFRSQFNVSTKKAYETFVKSNFSNIVQDVVVMNNAEYLDSYLKYYYNIGLTKPQFESRALYNQVNFSDSCAFNNVYLFCVPKTIQNSLSYLTPSQKTLVIDTIRDEQVLTSETILADPVYIAFDLCVQSENTITKTDINDSELYIIKDANNRRSDSSIKNDIQNAIVDFFSVTKNTLGQSINMQQLNTTLLDIDGVNQVYTRNKVTNSLLEGVSMVYWNPVYFDVTVSQTPTTLKLENFQFPFLNNKSFVDRITIG
jgi:hypothetical protein